MRKDGVKFGCLCLQASSDWMLGQEQEADLGHGFFLARPWREFDFRGWSPALGSWRLEEIQSSQIWIWSTAASEHLHVTDNENEVLADRMQVLWKALQLCEPAVFLSAWIFTGAIHDGRPDIATLRSLPNVFVKQPSRERGHRELQAAAALALALQEAFSAGRVVGRLERGLAALLSGMLSDTMDNSVLCFTRALEGVLHPNERRQFVSRGARVISIPNETETILGELYDFRSGLAHAESFETIFPRKTFEQATHRGQQLQAFAYLAAARVYSCILASTELLRWFASEELGEYWGRVVSGRKAPPFQVTIRDDEWLFGPDAFPATE
jgi:hypothetical protein